VALIWRVLALLRNDPQARFKLPGKTTETVETNQLHAALAGIGDRLTALESRPSVVAVPVDQAALDLAVGKALSDMASLAAVAKAVADELHKRTEA